MSEDKCSVCLREVSDGVTCAECLEGVCLDEGHCDFDERLTKARAEGRAEERAAVLREVVAMAGRFAAKRKVQTVDALNGLAVRIRTLAQQPAPEPRFTAEDFEKIVAISRDTKRTRAAIAELRAELFPEPAPKQPDVAKALAALERALRTYGASVHPLINDAVAALRGAPAPTDSDWHLEPDEVEP